MSRAEDARFGKVWAHQLHADRQSIRIEADREGDPGRRVGDADRCHPNAPRPRPPRLEDESQLRELDPDNRLYARQSRYRLPAEMVRDNLLSISGLLINDYGGAKVINDKINAMRDYETRKKIAGEKGYGLTADQVEISELGGRRKVVTVKSDQ